MSELDACGIDPPQARDKFLGHGETILVVPSGIFAKGINCQIRSALGISMTPVNSGALKQGYTGKLFLSSLLLHGDHALCHDGGKSDGRPHGGGR